MSNLQVKLIGNPETDGNGDVLGISLERKDELLPFMKEAVESSTHPYEAIAKMSIHAAHANELVFMATSTYSWFERNNNPFNSLLSMLKGGKD